MFPTRFVHDCLIPPGCLLQIGSGSGDMRQLLQAARASIDVLAEEASQSQEDDGIATEEYPRLVGIRQMASGFASLQASSISSCSAQTRQTMITCHILT